MHVIPLGHCTVSFRIGISVSGYTMMLYVWIMMTTDRQIDYMYITPCACMQTEYPKKTWGAANDRMLFRSPPVCRVRSDVTLV